LEFSRTRTHYLVFKEQVLGAYYCSNFAAVVKGFVSASRLLPLPSGNCFCNPIRLPCQPFLAVYFLPRQINPATFQATVIYIQSPPPCQAPCWKKVANGQTKTSNGNLTNHSPLF